MLDQEFLKIMRLIKAVKINKTHGLKVGDNVGERDGLTVGERLGSSVVGRFVGIVVLRNQGVQQSDEMFDINKRNMVQNLILTGIMLERGLVPLFCRIEKKQSFLLGLILSLETKHLEYIHTHGLRLGSRVGDFRPYRNEKKKKVVCERDRISVKIKFDAPTTLTTVGMRVGSIVGLRVGLRVGDIVGANVGSNDGDNVGANVGSKVLKYQNSEFEVVSIP